MNEVKRVSVEIDGETITLFSDENEAYLNELASYIEVILGKIAPAEARSLLHTRMLNLTASIIITDELFKEREAQRQTKNELAASQNETDRLRSLVDELWLALEQTWNDMNATKEELAKASHEAREYKVACERAKEELAEYIDAFEESSTIKDMYMQPSHVASA
ncbi:MAG: cell division protein ZapA [Clostridiales bacterium]|jgi:cell division protein ZapA (FtsZ GTPase activity inhibitor)|nr:cell division protein ZapA [Clostridiales bacterium]